MKKLKKKAKKAKSKKPEAKTIKVNVHEKIKIKTALH